MASEQVRRENVADKRNTEVEKDVVPKMRTHFESLAEKAKSPQGSPTASVGSAGKVHQYETLPLGVGETKVEEGQKWGRDRREDVEREGEGRYQGPSLEDISKLRATAQQNSMEVIRAAEERYDKAKESGASAVQKTRESAIQGKDDALRGLQRGGQYVADQSGALKDTAVQKGQQAKDYTVEKMVGAKDAVASTGQSAAGYTADKVNMAKDTTMDTTKNVASYVGDRAAAAKDATVEGGKGAAGYAGKVATEAKDQAVAAGWGVTNYTLEKVADATKAVAGVTSSVAGYTGEKTVAAKDKVVGTGQTVMDYAGEKLAAAKDALVASEEKAAESAGRKKVDAQKDLEEKKAASHEMGERGETFETRGERGAPTEKLFNGKAADEQMPRPRNGGVFQAIGETLMEIGQTAKDLLVGQYPMQVLEQKDHGSKDREGEAYRGAGEGI